VIHSAGAHPALDQASVPLAGPDSRRVSAREGYGLWAASYDVDPNPLLSLEERVIEPLLPDTRQKDVVDLGCGTGRWLRKLWLRGARSAWGLDFTPQMLSRAACDSRLTHRLVLGDCVSLPLRSRIADLIVCSFTLGHIDDLDGLAQEIARISRPQAELFISALHPEALAAGWRCAFRHQGRKFEIGGERHARARVHAAFLSAGFAPRQSLNTFIGEPERPIFELGGKSGMFEIATSLPALAIDHFVFRSSKNIEPSFPDTA
jgi:SAM-dependent methyltransferase